MSRPVCNEDFCPYCGDCMDCYWEDRCYCDGRHRHHYEIWRETMSKTAETPVWLSVLQTAIPAPPAEEREINGHTYKMRSLTSRERDDWDREMVEFVGEGKNRKVKMRIPDNMRAKLVSRCLVAIDGVDIPSDAQSRAQLEQLLAQADAKLVNELFEWAQQLNGMVDEAIEAAVANLD